MDVQANGAEAPGGSAFTPTLPENTGPINARTAGQMIAEARAKAITEAEQPAERQRAPNGQFAKPQESPAQAEDAAPPQEATGETQDADPAEVPPLERPRSWSADRDEQWTRLDRATQEYLLEHDKTSSAEVRRAQNEAAETRKAVEAERKTVETARQQYEQAAQRTLQFLQSEMTRDFSDIKTMVDVQNLANNDPFRFAQFQARQMQLQAQTQEVETLQQQAAEEKRKTFESWAKEQDEKFNKQFPEFADKDKAPEITKNLARYLTDEVGVPADALPQLRNEPLFRDAMYQRVLYDAYRFHTAQQKAKAAVAVPKPAPQRPGTAPDKGAQVQDAIAAAQARLKSAKGNAAADAAAQLIAAKRAAARR